MYLRDSGIFRPALDIRLNEPELLRTWFINLPFGAMIHQWKLSRDLGLTWYQHFNERILAPNYGNCRVQSNVQLAGGQVNSQSLAAMHRKWEEWMDSSENPALFGSVKLKTFYNIHKLGGLLLGPDVYCCGCDSAEPLWLYQGTEVAYSEVHPTYKSMINKALAEGLFGESPEVSECPTCALGMYITPSYARYARCRPGMCECMPCRRSL